MLAYTVKNYIKYLKDFAGNNSYEVTFRGLDTNKLYKFKINKDLILEISYEDEDELLLTITNIENENLPDKLYKPLQLIETSYRPDNSIFEKNEANIYYEAQLYYKLFRLMKERVDFVFRHESKYYKCYYVDGKVLFADETATKYKIVGTDLFKLSTTHRKYQILYITPSLKRPSYGTYLDQQHAIADSKGKEFKKCFR